MTQTLAPGTIPVGLTSAEVRERIRQGQVNKVERQTSRSYWSILAGNLFNLFNLILAVIAVTLMAIGEYRDALFGSSIVLINVAVGIFQEIRAKIALDRLALLATPRVRVLRDGEDRVILIDEVVVGDALLLAAGDQVVADGPLVEAHSLEVDESLLTGESDYIKKRAGDPVLSGSFCVAGQGIYLAEKVGRESFVRTLTAEAKQFRNVQTPLQREINRILKLMVAVMVALCLILLARIIVQDKNFTDGVKETAATVVALVPEGLVLLTTVAFALGATRIARKGTLVQQMNAIESICHLTVLCTDKTGTLTQNRLELQELVPLGAQPAASVQDWLSAFAASCSEQNKTIQAIASHWPHAALPVAAEVPFNSARKWSAVQFAPGGPTGRFYLGAPELLLPNIPAEAGEQVRRLAAPHTAQGLRVLLFAGAPAAPELSDDLPAALTPLALAVVADALRPEAKATLAYFARRGIQVKVISGDNPDTVAALARQAGLVDASGISGPELDELEGPAFGQAVREHSIFGRITPRQKRRIVRELRAQGQYVGMIGDGVNDLLSLKEANLGIAMNSGSQATKSIADVVLLTDSFGTLPAMMAEGSKILGNIQRVAALFLTKNIYAIYLVLLTGFIGLAFPFVQRQVSVVSFLTIGLPSFFLTLMTPPERRRDHFLAHVLSTAFVVGTVTAAVALGGFLLTTFVWHYELRVAQTVLIATLALTGLLVTLLIDHEPDEPYRAIFSDYRRLLIVGGGAGCLLGILYIPLIRNFFDLRALDPLDLGLVLVGSLLAFAALSLIRHVRLVERLLA